MILSRCEMNLRARTRINAIQCTQRRIGPGSKQRESMYFRNNEVCRDERHLSSYGLSKQEECLPDHETVIIAGTMQSAYGCLNTTHRVGIGLRRARDDAGAKGEFWLSCPYSRLVTCVSIGYTAPHDQGFGVSHQGPARSARSIPGDLSRSGQARSSGNPRVHA